MKRIFTYAIIAVSALVVLAGCTRNRDYYDDRVYYEQGIVEASDYSPWIVVSFNDGTYAVMKAVESNNLYWPVKNDVLQGDFRNTGSRSFKNITGNYTFNGLIVSFPKTWDQARDDWNYYATKDGYPSENAVSRLKPILGAARTGKISVK